VAAGAKSILIIGDSLSAGYGIDVQEGWPVILEEKLDKMQCDYSVINDSIDGDTTSNGFSRINQALVDYDPAVVVIALGGNDGLRAITPASMKNNLSYMIEGSRNFGADVLLVAVRLPPNYGQTYISQYRQVFFDIEKSCNVPLVPEVLKNVGGVAGLIQSDGIHPNAKAQPIIFNNVWRKLQPMLSCTVRD